MLKTIYDRLTDQPFKATREKIDRHLRDINDTISEEDIRRITPPVVDDRIKVSNGIIEFPERNISANLEKKNATSKWNIVS
jgi:hypothetical protein